MGNCKCGNCEKDEALEKILEVYKQDKDNLIQILNDVQEHYGCTSSKSEDIITGKMGRFTFFKIRSSAYDIKI